MEVLDLVKLLSDRNIIKILSLTFKHSRSAHELSEQLGIPVAVCYKKINKLSHMGLIKCVEKKPSGKGRCVNLFRSQVKSAYIFFDKGSLRVRMELTQVNDNIYDKSWDVLKEMDKYPSDEN